MSDLGKPRNAASSVSGVCPIIYSHGSLDPVSDGPHKSLLDLLVWTDTKGVGRGVRGVVSDPTMYLRCDVCGFDLRFCDCIVGKDY